MSKSQEQKSQAKASALFAVPWQAREKNQGKSISENNIRVFFA